jgi:toxin ParE1/3/4
MARVIRSRQAQRDISEIWTYIAQKSEDRADLVLRKINEKLDTCLMFPTSGRRRPRFGKHIRTVSAAGFRIFYEPVDDGILVVRVLHGARDDRRAFFEEDDDV